MLLIHSAAAHYHFCTAYLSHTQTPRTTGLANTDLYFLYGYESAANKGMTAPETHRNQCGYFNKMPYNQDLRTIDMRMFQI